MCLCGINLHVLRAGMCASARVPHDSVVEAHAKRENEGAVKSQGSTYEPMPLFCHVSCQS